MKCVIILSTSIRASASVIQAASNMGEGNLSFKYSRKQKIQLKTMRTLVDILRSSRGVYPIERLVAISAILLHLKRF